MKERVMILKVKINDNSRFVEKHSARLFNDKEMKKLVEMTSAYVNCGCEIKVEVW